MTHLIEGRNEQTEPIFDFRVDHFESVTDREGIVFVSCRAPLCRSRFNFQDAFA